jgi:hypothetical protein
MSVSESSLRPGGPPIDPRLRQRWVDARRAEGRRRLRILIALLAVLVLIVAAWGVLHSPVLRVRHVRVTGLAASPASPAGDPTASGLTARQIVRQAGLAGRRLMIDVRTGQEATLIEALPWVAQARVVRQWPGTVAIRVTTRSVVAQVDRVPGQAASGVSLLDRTGRVLAQAPTAIAGLPLIAASAAPGAPGTWLAGSPGPPYPQAGGVNEAVALELAGATALPRSLAPSVSTIEVTSGQLEMVVGSTIVLFGDGTQMAQKVAAMATILDHVSFLGVAEVDLRVPDRPALTPSHGSTSVSTTAGG